MVIIGLGSNVGERGAMLDAAVEKLGRILSNIKVSARYETGALLLPGSPPEWDIPFLNMAITGTTSLPPAALLTHLKEMERELGRKERGRWAPREIDMDILAYDDVVLEEEGLVIPHPGLLTRYFALAPLAEIAPDWTWPVKGERYGKTAQALLAELFP